jgi:predicted nucleic acid-binding protein
MVIFVDTNPLLRYVEIGHPHHQQAAEALEQLRTAGHDLAIVPQVVFEFWVVATRPAAQNGLGLAAERTAEEIDRFVDLYSVFHDDHLVYEAWRDLVTRYKVLGKPAHDARLVAAMLRHGVTRLLTFNAPDFARYAEITAISPEAAATFPPAA